MPRTGAPQSRLWLLWLCRNQWGLTFSWIPPRFQLFWQGRRQDRGCGDRSPVFLA
ncbi:hypothetical protein [Nostoc sp.]|uniref:hypothetical protein n=1 Tax=Nostoc sp. TaxID=1180 RepID=UPI002FF845D6